METEATENPIGRFRHAVHARDAALLRQLLESSASARAAINEPLFGFDSPALVAVAGDGDVELVDTLLDFGADPNRRSSWWAGGFHPLHAAQGPVSERLLAAGAIPDACAAANLDRPDLLTQLLEADPSRVHDRGGDGQTPLHFARSRAVVDLLLAAGADIDARDIDHRSTPAEWMTGDHDKQEARIELARYLVDRGASVDIFLTAALGMTDRARRILEADPAALRLRTGQGAYGEQPPSSFHIYLWTLGSNRSPMQVAAERGWTETLRLMERFGGPAERLLLACHTGDADAARAIARNHPGLVASLGDVDRRALTDEAWSANTPAVELLLELGFDPAVPSVSGPSGGTALHCASWEGSVGCVSAILRYPSGRALVDARESSFNGTPLSWCSHGSVNCDNLNADHAAVARLLIASGAHVDAEMLDWGGSEGVRAAIAEALRGR